MGKRNKKRKAAAAAAAVVAAEAPNGMAGTKREAQDEIKKAVSAKKQKAAPPAKAVPPPKEGANELPKEQPPPKKVESRSSEEEHESKPEEEVKMQVDEPAKPTNEVQVKMQVDESAKPTNEESSDDRSEVSSESAEEPAKEPAAELPTKVVLDEGKEQSSGADDSKNESDGNNKPTAPLEQPAVTGSEKEGSDGLGDGIDDELKTPSQAQGSKIVFMGNYPFKAELDQVKEFFKEAGEIIDIRFPLWDDGTRKPFCYVEFASVEAAQKAVQFNGREFMSRPVKLDLAVEKGSNTKPAIPSIFVRGFDKSLSEEQIRSSLQQHFGECGEITRISIPPDNETGAIRGAYINFKEQDSLSKALKLNGSDLGGFELYVVGALPRVENHRGGSRGRSVGRFGGRSGGGFGGRSGGRFGGRSGGRFGGRSGGGFGGPSGGRFGGRSGGRFGGPSGGGFECGRGRSGGRRGGGRFGGRNSGRGGRGFSNNQSAGKKSYWDDL